MSDLPLDINVEEWREWANDWRNNNIPGLKFRLTQTLDLLARKDVRIAELEGALKQEQQRGQTLREWADIGAQELKEAGQKVPAVLYAILFLDPFPRPLTEREKQRGLEIAREHGWAAQTEEK